MAQDKPSEPSQPNVAAPQRVEVNAQQGDMDQRRRESVAKSIYGREELDKYGDTNVSDVLKRLPGINVTAGNPRLRGLGAGYTLILINGEPAPPGFSLDNLSPSQVERIEVTKGPTAEHSTQAVAGTINIILREAPRQRQRELRLGVGYQKLRPVASFNATYGDRIGALGVALPLSGYQWRGGAVTRSERLGRDSQLQLQRLAVAGHEDNWGGGFNFGPRLNWKFSDADSLNWQSFLQRHNFNSAGGFLTKTLAGMPPASIDDVYENHGHWQMLRSSLQWVRRWDDGARVDMKLGGQASGSRSRTDVVGLDGLGLQSLTRITQGENRERIWNTSGKYSRPLFERHNLSVGWDLERKHRRELRSVFENGAAQLSGFDGEPFEANIERVAVYAQDEWEISTQWSTYLGLRAERIGTKSAGAGDALSNQSSVLSPLWHLNYKLSPGGRDLVRASLTRSYKAPDLSAMMARPSINFSYPKDFPNAEIGPDRLGNPDLRPELATGLDVALEKYLPNGGLVSLSVFHRRIEGLIRNAVTLESVGYTNVSRWVSRPINLALARSSGIELEVKGRASELLPSLFAPATALTLRSSMSIYRSSVEGIPSPDNRLESQQPWSMTGGFDHVVQGRPLTWGASFSFSPGYSVQQTIAQRLEQVRARSVDAYVLWTIDRQTMLRLAVNNLLPLDSSTRTSVQETAGGELLNTTNRRTNRANVQAGLTLKF